MDNIHTARLTLDKLNINDHPFIMELLNTSEWIKNIGDRNVRTIDEAKLYIQKILDDPNLDYWVVKLKKRNTSIGIITFIKRGYLEHYDIGFAFLPDFTSKGYAYEATRAVLNEITTHSLHSKIQAITIEENSNSVKLLQKLGFEFEKKIMEDNSPLLVYSISQDLLSIGKLTQSFFGLFTNKSGLVPRFENILDTCLSETTIIKKNGEVEEIYDIDTFIKPRKELLTNGTLTEFEEYETFAETKVVGNIAQRFSRFKKQGYSNNQYFKDKGNKFFQFVNTTNGWKIANVIWEDDKL